MPGAVSEGETRDEALENVREAMEGRLELTLQRGAGPLPESPELVPHEVGRIPGFRAEAGWDMVVETAIVEPTVAVAA